MATIAESFDEHWLEDPQTGCWIWQRGCTETDNSSGGYGCLQADGRQIGAHRFSYERTYGPISKGLMVRHSCHMTKCVNPAHLLVGTHLDNMEDKIKAGLSGIILNPADVRQIRFLHTKGWSKLQLSRYFAVVDQTIYDIFNGKLWSHVQ